MINTETDQRIVLTLDAGGTNFVFSAIQGNNEIVERIRYNSNADDLEKCMSTVVKGFEEVLLKLGKKADAISFAFPGPADYENGIIGDLPNFPSFKGGVPLGPLLEEKFGLPVFINNDGDLFAYGEALCGVLPELNSKLKKANRKKQHKNLIGITLGTGIGCGIVVGKGMLRGDNSCGAEIHNTINKYNSHWNAEESVSTRAIQRVYAEQAKLNFNSELMPEDIYNIAIGKQEGDATAAIEAFSQFGENLGSSIANVVTLIDGLIVLGGGITAAWELFAPAMFTELSRQNEDLNGVKSDRLSYSVYNLEDQKNFDVYAKGASKELVIPGSNKVVQYDSLPRTGVAISKLGASKAIALGAYAYALQNL